MHDFDYEAPTSLTEAMALVARHGGRARMMAGGTDLIDQIRMGRFAPDLLIDVKQIPELNQLASTDDGLRVGAAVPCFRIYGESKVVQHYTALADSCRIIGGVQIQSRASIGGNLCNSGPAADSTPSMIALGGVAIAEGPDGRRDIPVETFCTGPGKNTLQPFELLTEIRFDTPAPHSGSCYRRLIPRNEMDIAVVGVGAAVTLDPEGRNFISARVALGAVAATPLFVEDAGTSLMGQPVNDATIEKAAGATREAASPITDMRGTKEYRLHVTAVLTRRVINAAVARARGETVDYRPGH